MSTTVKEEATPTLKEDQDIEKGVARNTDNENLRKDNTAEGNSATIPEETQVTVEQPSKPKEDLSHLPENVRILKEAFPDIDVEVIEAILQTQGNSIDGAFESLLGMSDPNYQPSSPTIPVEDTQRQPQQTTPPMPPRPSFQTEEEAPRAHNNNQNQQSHWERQQQMKTGPISVEEQLRMDEEFAKRLLMEDEQRIEQRRQRHLQKQQRRESDDDSIFNLQEELPIIKEKMKEAGNAAKKKVMDFFNQIKANSNNNANQPESSGGSYIPTTTNAQYRGLPSDDGDDLLTGDISALHLSDYDVYAQTGGRQKQLNDIKKDNNDTILTNPLLRSQTSTSDAQLKADADFARQLAQEDQLETRRSRHASSEDNTLRAPLMSSGGSNNRKSNTTPTVVIAPRSPLEFEGDSDYEDVGLTASSNRSEVKNTNASNTSPDNTSVPYVIGDDDDSDSDDLVDIDDDDELFDVEKDKKDEDKVVKKIEVKPVSAQK